MASIGSTSGHQEGQLPFALAKPYVAREEASLPRFFPLVEPMLVIGLLPIEMGIYMVLEARLWYCMGGPSYPF